LFASLLRRTSVGSIFIKEYFYALRNLAGSRVRWVVLKKNGLVTVGRHTYGTPNVYYWDDKTKMRIGKYCSIAENVVVLLGGEHRLDWITTFPFNAFHKDWPAAKFIEGHPASKGDIEIGNDVWIGHGAIILSGVHIGNGAVIGAGTVVTKNVDDYAIISGNPGRFVRFRFDEKTRAHLLDMAWWHWSEEKINANLKDLSCPPTESQL
jgi:acetyltransferase-like isoleucine patch superfamily enzyme